MMPENILKTMHLKRDGPKITILKQNNTTIMPKIYRYL